MKFLSYNVKLYVILVFILTNLFIWHAVLAQTRGGILTVSFLDVGQGDATFIQTPSGRQVLIDGGSNKKVLQALGEVMPFYDRSIDVVIATHPDQDHIGGLSSVISRFDVDVIIASGNQSNTAANDAFEKAAAQESAARILGRRGQIIDFEDGAVLFILYPDRDVSDLESNTASIVARLVYGDTEFIFTGDAPKSIERYLVFLDSAALKSDVLKVGHHGSKTSTDTFFLGAVAPEYAIISAGKNNRYGHPHNEVLKLLYQFGANIFRTDEEETIIIESDGNKIIFKSN